MINLVKVEVPPTFAPPQNLSDYAGVTFYVVPAVGPYSEADWCAFPLDDPFPGRTELVLVFAREQTEEKIEELRKLLENRINNFPVASGYFCQLVEKITQGLEGYNVVAHSSCVPS